MNERQMLTNPACTQQTKLQNKDNGPIVINSESVFGALNIHSNCCAFAQFSQLSAFIGYKAKKSKILSSKQIISIFF